MNTLEKEKAVGLALRAIVQDITDEVKHMIQELYDDTEIGQVCYKWHMRCVCYFGNMDHASPYISIIQRAFQKGRNLDEMETWRSLMRIKVGAEYMELMNKYTQIPQLAARDLSDKKEKYQSNPWG